MVRLLELEPGRDEGSMELSLLREVGLPSDFDSVPYVLPRLLNVEPCLLRPAGACALHLLF